MTDIAMKKGAQKFEPTVEIPPEDETSASRPAPAAFFSSMPRDLFLAALYRLIRMSFDEMNRVAPTAGMPSSGLSPAIWFPPIEVAEEDGYFIVSVELPGLKKEDITVAVTEEGLVISGQRQPKPPDRIQGIRRSERGYGSFCRTIPIPDDADVHRAAARFENGLLTVSIPVPDNVRWRRDIPIQP